MVHWDSSGRLSGLCHHMHWTLSLPVSYTADWTTATLFLLVYQLVTFNICSEPYIWSPAHHDVITWPLCCAIATGFLLSSASNTSCVRLFTVVCTATHHPTSSTSSSRFLLQVVWNAAELMTVAVPCTLSSLGDRSFATASLPATSLPARFYQATITIPSDAVRWHF